MTSTELNALRPSTISNPNAIHYTFSASDAHSGSTLLAFVLNTHPQIATISEMQGLIKRVDAETYHCSCGRLILECPFWQELRDRMAAMDQTLDLDDFDMHFRWTQHIPLIYLQKASLRNRSLEQIRCRILPALPGFRSAIGHSVRRTEALARSMLDATGADVVFDTSKDVTRIHYLHHYSDMSLKVIHLVRDVRGVVASMKRRYPAMDLRKPTQRWVKKNRYIERMVQDLPSENVMRLRYEDLCREPLATFQQLSAFMSVPILDDMPPFRSVEHHIIGATMRMQSSSEIKLDERWKAELTAAEQDQVNAMTVSLREQYGYTD